MLIDELLPAYQFSERHETVVRASADETYRALREADFADSPLVRLLLVVRELPTRLAGRLRARPPRLSFREITRSGFRELAEDPGRELVLGISGRFWRLAWKLDEPIEHDFAKTPSPGTARAIINFTTSAEGPRSTRLATETRIFCADAPSLKSFRRYWTVIRPFSGFIRTRMLRSIRAAAERP